MPSLIELELLAKPGRNPDTVYLYSYSRGEMDKPYSVSLQGVEGLPGAERISAELRFIRELERAFGSSEAVADVYRAWRDACECDASELSVQVSSLAVRWPKAFDAAQRAGLKNIGDSDAHFELQLGQRSVSCD